MTPRRFRLTVAAPAATTLAQAAAQLGPGQSIKVQTLGRVYGGSTYENLRGAHMKVPEDGSIKFFQWLNSFGYDSTRKEVRALYKRAGAGHYHWAIYDETTNRWDVDSKAGVSRPTWVHGEGPGHGYDSNGLDSATGTSYFNSYDTATLHVWNGSWTETPSWTASTGIGTTGGGTGVAYFPGVGALVNGDEGTVCWNGSTWQALRTGGAGTGTLAEYNSTANAVLVGGGSVTQTPGWWRIGSTGTVTPLGNPLGNPPMWGTSENGLLPCGDPASANFICYDRAHSRTWWAWNIATDSWSAITTKHSGNAAGTVYTGVPAAIDSSIECGCCALPDHGCTMWIADYGGFTSDDGVIDVWLYRHTG